jgi:hypothetical protein
MELNKKIYLIFPQMRLPMELKNSLILVPGRLQYSNLKALAQFNLKDFAMKPLSNQSEIIIVLNLKRIFSYHLTNTYMPTSTLLIIAEITLYFDEDKTEVAIGLSLTIMLVMYTMYQSISDSLIKTAYLKMIDYWLLFCLLMPFFIFMIEIYWLLKMKKELKSTEKGWVDDKQKINANRKVIRHLVFAITLLYTIIYTLVSLVMYNDLI